MLTFGLLACARAAPPPAPTAGSAPPQAPPAAASGAAPAPAAPATLTRVQYGGLPTIGTSLMHVASTRGYFREEGLEVEVMTLASGSELLPAMAGGQLDVGASSPGAALFNAIGRDIPLKIVADASQYKRGYPTGSYVVRKDLYDSGAMRDYPDLKGKTIAVTGKGVATQMIVLRTLEMYGLQESDVNLQTMNFVDMLLALSSKQIDVAQETEPYVTQGIEQGILVRWKGNDELFPDQQQAVIMYAPRFAEEKRDAANRFMVAYLRIVRDYIAAFGPEKRGQDDMVQQLMVSFDLKDPDVYRKAVPTGLDVNGALNVADLKVQQDWYVKNGFVKEPVPIDDVVDTSFVEYAQRRLGRQ